MNIKKWHDYLSLFSILICGFFPSLCNLFHFPIIFISMYSNEYWLSIHSILMCMYVFYIHPSPLSIPPFATINGWWWFVFLNLEIRGWKGSCIRGSRLKYWAEVVIYIYSKLYSTLKYSHGMYLEKRELWPCASNLHLNLHLLFEDGGGRWDRSKSSYRSEIRAPRLSRREAEHVFLTPRFI